MKILFSLLLLANAALLFWVELLYGKRLLPALGGAPSVWNTCLMFYQVILLAGYAYALAVNRLALRGQVLVHGAVLGLTVAALPWALFVWPDPGGRDPILWLLALLTLSVGPPLFVLAAGAPLLQRWFSLSRHPDRHDPYFLFAASNLGSFVGLAAYPVVFEPLMTLDWQAAAWRMAYGAVALLVLGGGAWALRGGAGESRVPLGGGPPPGVEQGHPQVRGGPVDDPLTVPRRLGWIGLAFLPSSLLLGVTTHITSEIAPVPLLWIVPLALYLLTFVVAFGPARRRMREGSPPPGKLRLLAWLGVAAAVLGGLLLAGVPLPRIQWVWVLAHLGMLVLAGLVCHLRLARDRPHPRHLAEFYLWIALGGALGGVFNALLAPILFTDPMEYPLALAALAFLVASGTRRGGPGLRPSDLLLGSLPGLAVLGLAFLFAPDREVNAAALLLIPGAICLALAGRPARFGIGVAGLVLVGFSHPVTGGQVLFKERTFFGIHRIYQDDGYLWLAHGTTVHGGQHRERPEEPLTYYHPAGPAGSLFRSFDLRRADGVDAENDRVAVIGLGTGSLIAYARNGQEWAFYELDPAVIRIAEDDRFFSFLADSPAAYRNVLGDARLSLERGRGGYDLIVVDAFSSDAVPVHLLTREAMELYLGRLRHGGWTAFHVSNRYLDLSGVLADVAAELGLQAYEARDEVGHMARGYYPSHWVLLTPEPVTFPDPRWEPLGPTGGRVWTDSYSSLLPLLRW